MSAVGEASDVDTRVEFLTVRIGDDRFAVEVGAVARLASFDPSTTTRVPNGPETVAGVTAVDGDVTVVVDLSRSAGDAATGDARLVVFEREGRPVGLAVDELLGIDSYPTGCIAPGWETTAGVDDRWVKATIAREDGRTPVVDPNGIVSGLDT